MNILKVPNRFGETLGRMGGEYKILQKDEDGFVITAPASFAEVHVRMGGEYKRVLDSEYLVYKATECSDEAMKVNFNTNQDQITQIKQKGNDAEALVKLNQLVSYDNGDGSKKWLCFIVHTNYKTIIGIKINGKTLTESDVQDADMFGGGVGDFLVWIEATNQPTHTTKLTIGTKGATTETVTITVKEQL